VCIGFDLNRQARPLHETPFLSPEIHSSCTRCLSKRQRATTISRRAWRMEERVPHREATGSPPRGGNNRKSETMLGNGPEPRSDVACRSAGFDGIFSVSALQWLCASNSPSLLDR
jgi:hypothetical protein